MIRLYHVALMVPAIAREAANMIVRDTTGNPADINSFSIECVEANGATWWACQMPISPVNFARLPEIQAVTGGHFEVLRTFDPRAELLQFSQALELHNIEPVGSYDVEG